MSAPALTPAPGARSMRQAEIGLLVMVALWAINFPVIKIGLAYIPPYGFNALRFPLAALFLAAVLLAREGLSVPDRGDAARIVVLGIIGNFLYQLLFIAGLARSRAGNASVLLNTSPIYTVILSSLLGHERIRTAAWAGIAATVAGIALVVGSGEGGLRFGTATVGGDLMMLSAAAIWAVYTVGSRDMVRKYGSVPVTAWTLWAGAALLVVAGIPELRGMEGSIPPTAWASLIYAGFLGLGLSYLLWYRGVHVLGNTRTSAFGNLVPVVTILLAWPMLGEVPNLWQIVGAIVIIAGISVVRRVTEAA